jgi:hypothetical protein
VSAKWRRSPPSKMIAAEDEAKAALHGDKS